MFVTASDYETPAMNPRSLHIVNCCAFAQYLSSIGKAASVEGLKASSLLNYNCLGLETVVI